MAGWRSVIGLILALVWAAPSALGSEAAAWEALKAGGAYAITRHALAPGTGDPEYFVLDDCTTQRNLNDTGRDQARRLGDAIRSRGTGVGGVYSSQWCRCLETARLLGLGDVSALPPLNSFFETPERREPQMAALRAWLADRATFAAAGAVVLVTHQVNITALTGVFPASGEPVVFRVGNDGAIEVIGRIPAP